MTSPDQTSEEHASEIALPGAAASGPIGPIQKWHATAVILHIFYPELLDEIDSHLANLGNDFDLFISIPEGMPLSPGQVKERYPLATVLQCENRGRDISPFLAIFSAIHPLQYDHICKIHTKKSRHREDGDQWRRDVLEKLLGSPETVVAAKQLMDSDRQVGMLAPGGHRLSGRLYMGGNGEKCAWLARRAGVDFNDRYSFDFVAGSMFWVKPDALHQLASINLTARDFEEEAGTIDGTLAHAFERFFGILVHCNGFQIEEIGADGGDPGDYRYAPTPPWHVDAGIGSDREKLIEELRVQIMDREHVRQQMAAEIAERDARIGSLNTRLGHLASQLEDIYRSKGWRLLQSIRKLLQIFHRK